MDDGWLDRAEAYHQHVDSDAALGGWYESWRLEMGALNAPLDQRASGLEALDRLIDGLGEAA